MLSAVTSTSEYKFCLVYQQNVMERSMQTLHIFNMESLLIVEIKHNLFYKFYLISAINLLLGYVYIIRTHDVIHSYRI